MSRLYGVQIAVTNALENLAHIELEMGAYTKAEEVYKTSLKHSSDIDYELGRITACAGLGEVALRRKAYLDAKQHFQEGLRLAEKRMLVNPATMRIFVGTAELFLEQGQPEWAAALIALSLHHPASEEPVREQSRRLFPVLKASLPPHLFTDAWERGAKAELATVRTQLLAAFDQLSFAPTSQAALPVDSSLSKRELEILRLIADGLANQEIADRLFLSLGTVRWYTNQIYSKLGVENRVQAVRYAQQLNLI
jgi:DNA-binding CsgD family transcriptional regulator